MSFTILMSFSQVKIHHNFFFLHSGYVTSEDDIKKKKVNVGKDVHQPSHSAVGSDLILLWNRALSKMKLAADPDPPSRHSYLQNKAQNLH